MVSAAPSPPVLQSSPDAAKKPLSLGGTMKDMPYSQNKHWELILSKFLRRSSLQRNLMCSATTAADSNW